MNEAQKKYILNYCQELINYGFEKNVNLTNSDWEILVDNLCKFHKDVKENKICGELLSETVQFLNKMQKIMEKPL